MSPIDAVELRRVRLPLVTPFRTSFGTQHDRDVLVVRVEAFGAEGWGECVAMREPVYNEEWVDGAQDILSRILVPAAVESPDLHSAADLARVLAPFHGNRMAKAAFEMALLDAELRAQGRSFAQALGATAQRVPSGVSVGIFDSIGALLDAVHSYLGAGYQRIKLKIEPGWDIDVVSTIRHTFPDAVLQVDANAAYTLADADQLVRLDEFDLLLVEQPFPKDHLADHARLAERMKTPICLDESITSLQVCLDAIALRATAVVNLKAGRVGGYLAARTIAEACAQRDVPVWCGGMVETGLGRAANAALAAHPAMQLPGDVSAASRFYARDIVTEPAILEDGHIAVPAGPGLGVTVDLGYLDEVTTERRLVHA